MKHRVLAFAWLIGLTGCATTERQSALDPAGFQAESIFTLWTYMWITAAVVYVAVMIGFAVIVRDAGRQGGTRTVEREAKARRTVQLAMAVTLGILLVTLVFDFAIGRGLMHGDPKSVLTIRLTGHQWWWEVEYEDSIPQQRVMLANEIHLPVGRVVRITLQSHDVIHSFWVPNLGGKKDLIPGHDNDMWLRADREGVYRAQCAEFCGLQHAKMGLYVVVESGERFAAWLANERLPARAPADSQAVRGRQVFESGPCAVCHTISGTRAAGRVGPNLTHVASRLSIAAAALHNVPGNLAGWIADPQGIKPGAQMPPQPLSGVDLRAVVAYLETLK
jgi:cytochrome c oxidase subunit 2